jgi:serine/threonine protein phosphatase 1
MRYVIGDVHGCAKTLAALVYRGIKPKPKDSLYFLGDYVDRGPDSKTVLDLIMGWQEVCAVGEIVCLRGNHEELMLHGYNNPDSVWMQVWDNNGKEPTLNSFPNKQVDEKYFEFIRSMPLVVHVDGYYLAHAGIENIHRPLLSNPEILLWDREITPSLHKVIVGHTPQSIEQIQASLLTNKIIIDGGCVFNHKEMYGNLVALCLDTMELIIQENIDIPLTP